MAYRPHPKRASTNPSNPAAWATSDRSGFVVNHKDMAWQREWAGNQIINKRILVHPSELDKLQEQFRSLVLPPDPVPIMNARPEPYSIDESGPVMTQLTANALTGTQTLAVQSVTGFSHNQSIAVYLDNGGFAMETVTAVGANSLTISIPLPSQASTGQIVTAVA